MGNEEEQERRDSQIERGVALSFACEDWQEIMAVKQGIVLFSEFLLLLSLISLLTLETQYFFCYFFFFIFLHI